MDRHLFVAWQDDNRGWHTIGRLSRTPDSYEFAFTHGARPLAAVLQRVFGLEVGYLYRFRTLLPIFQTRIPSSSRPDFWQMSGWLQAGEHFDEFSLLSAFGRSPGTDGLLLYPPAQQVGSQFRLEFFVHGVRHMHSDVSAWISSARPGQVILPMLDVKNEVDPNAVALRAQNGTIILGYVPSFYARAVAGAIKDDRLLVNSSIALLAANIDAPAQLRLFCRFECPASPRLLEPSPDERVDVSKSVKSTTTAKDAVVSLPLMAGHDMILPP